MSSHIRVQQSVTRHLILKIRIQSESPTWQLKEKLPQAFMQIWRIKMILET